MNDKLYTAYGGDKIIDLENTNTQNAIKDVVGGSGGAVYFENTGEQLKATYNQVWSAIQSGSAVFFVMSQSSGSILYYDTISALIPPSESGCGVYISHINPNNGNVNGAFYGADDADSPLVFVPLG